MDKTVKQNDGNSVWKTSGGIYCGFCAQQTSLCLVEDTETLDHLTTAQDKKYTALVQLAGLGWLSLVSDTDSFQMQNLKKIKYENHS